MPGSAYGLLYTLYAREWIRLTVHIACHLDLVSSCTVLYVHAYEHSADETKYKQWHSEKNGSLDAPLLILNDKTKIKIYTQ